MCWAPPTSTIGSHDIGGSRQDMDGVEDDAHTSRCTGAGIDEFRAAASSYLNSHRRVATSSERSEGQ
jgi:hypothetical protein